MKFKFDIECTPKEARAFLGLPDVSHLHEAMMKEIEEKMRDNIRNLTPEEMVKMWMPATIQSVNELQKMFWSQMGGGNRSNPADQETKGKQDNSNE